MNIVLVEPEIPPNTGNIARLCAATCTRLHLIEPLGFQLDDRVVRRAGMDYWRHVDWVRWSDWGRFRERVPEGARLWFVESNGPRRYSEVSYGSEDFLVFGRETAGLPRAWLEAEPGQWVRLPMCHPDARSLNLSNCAAIVLYEALRQQGFGDEVLASVPD